MTVPHERFCAGFIRSWNEVTLRLVNLVNIIGFFFSDVDSKSDSLIP